MRMVFQTAADRPVDIDLEKRLLRGAVFATTGMASDGAIILPSGIAVEAYARNAAVTDRHQILPGQKAAQNPRTIGVATELASDDWELTATVAFADTDAGREFAHLYGVNEERRAYMRAWSIEGGIVERAQVDFKTARTIAGPYWSEDLAARLEKRTHRVLVATRFDMRLVAACAIGADRDALTRAARDGNGAALDTIARIDFEEASDAIETLQRDFSEWRERIARLEQDMQALRGDGASAAARGDSDALLREARALLALARGEKHGAQ